MSDWQQDLLKSLSEYGDDVTQEVKQAVEDTAKETVDLLKQTSPVKAKGKKRGKYRKGWRAKLTYDGATEKKLVVHNATDYQLTHLLEHGHVNRNGTFTAARPHIAAEEEQMKQKLEDKIRASVKG